MEVRWAVLLLVLGGLLALAGVVLAAVVGTVLLAIATSYVLLPVHRWFLRHGLTPYWGAIASALTATILTLLLSVPFGIVLYARRDVIRTLLDALRAPVSVAIADWTVTVDPTALGESIAPQLSSLAVSFGRQLSVLAAKLVVFVFVVFAILYYHRRLRALVFGPVPGEYHDILDAIHERVRGVLFGHYVLVLVGGAVTYVLGLGLFVVLGYRIPFGLALVAAMMWILPFISASPLVLAMAAYHTLSGEVEMALAVGVLGAILPIAVPNLLNYLVWRRLGEPERLSSAVYFVGFVGGGLSFGLVGLVAGPLTLGVLSSLTRLLASGAQPTEQGQTDQ